MVDLTRDGVMMPILCKPCQKRNKLVQGVTILVGFDGHPVKLKIRDTTSEILKTLSQISDTDWAATNRIILLMTKKP